MEDIDRTEYIKKIAFQLLQKGQPKDIDMNGIAHLAGVAYLGGYLAVNRGLNPELCICAGLLHDLWLYLNMSSHMIYLKHQKHGIYGGELANEILRDSSIYREDEIEVICRMIGNHNDKDQIHDEYSEVLKDADVLQHYLNNSEYDKRYNYHGRLEKLITSR